MKYKKISKRVVKNMLKNHEHYLKKDCPNWEQKKAKFIGVDLSKFDFSNMSLEKIDFIDSNLECANFKNSFLKDVNFENSKLNHTYFIGAEIYNTIFSKIPVNINCRNCYIKNSRFEQANNTDLSYDGLSYGYFSHTILDNVSFSDVSFSGAYLSKTIILESDFINCTLELDRNDLNDNYIINSNIKMGNFPQSSIENKITFCNKK